MPSIPFQWQQILDVFIVAVIIYFLLVNIKGTKISVILQGIALFAVVYYVCTILQLLTVVWVLEKLLFVGPIAFIIIFTPEIRHFLERASRTRMLFKPYYERDPAIGAEDIIEEMVKAMNAMRERKLGGLIGVLRDRSALEEMVLGPRLDALVSTDLILTIFDKSAPLHDGAIIIDDDILRYAACFFPLSERDQSIRQLGSRHHAGIGITERADIVVFVVSEETGAMSICHNGRIAYNLSGEQLAMLARLLLRPDPARASILPRPLTD